MLDPLHEDEDSPVPGLTHRYPDRVLLLITDMCSMYCRHCTRRRFAGSSDDAMPMDRIDRAIEYIAKTPQVRDVLLSGGDALLVSDKKLESIIKKLKESGVGIIYISHKMEEIKMISDEITISAKIGRAGNVITIIFRIYSYN